MLKENTRLLTSQQQINTDEDKFHDTVSHLSSNNNLTPLRTRRQLIKPKSNVIGILLGTETELCDCHFVGKGLVE
jgi:hypothetical protein